MTPQSPVLPDRPDLQTAETVFAKDQPEFNPLPALCFQGGAVLTRWKLSDEERERFLETGDIYILLQKQPDQLLTPVLPGVNPYEVVNESALPPRPDAEGWPEVIDPAQS